MKKVRCKHKFLERFSIKTGIPKQTLTGYINGKSKPSLGRAVWIEKVTGVPVDIWTHADADMIRTKINEVMSELVK